MLNTAAQINTVQVQYSTVKCAEQNRTSQYNTTIHNTDSALRTSDSCRVLLCAAGLEEGC